MRDVVNCRVCEITTSLETIVVTSYGATVTHTRDNIKVEW
jgi:hypothetical protein